MGLTYNVVDADGHILEPLNLWENYIDPTFRDRAPRRFIGLNGFPYIFIVHSSEPTLAIVSSSESERDGLLLCRFIIDGTIFVGI